MKNNLAVSLHKIPKEKQNKLIADLVNKHSKLEKQKKDNIVLLKSLANIKSDYHAKTKDSLVEFARIKEAFIKDLIEKSKKKSILKWEQGIISNIIRSEFEKLQDLNCISANCKAMMDEYTKQSYESMTKMERMMADEMMENLKSEMNLPDDFDASKMFDADYVKNLQDKMFEDQFHQQKIDLQEELFQNQKNLDIDFKQIYRKLARHCHPDLAKTTIEKEEKEHQIKRINQAWKNLDYYELIIVWMEIDPENVLEIELSEANCKKIIQHLTIKLNEEKDDNYAIKNEDPETAFYYHHFHAKNSKTVQNKIEKFANKITKDIIDTELRLEDIKTLANLKMILKGIYEEQERRDEMEREFSNFMDDEFFEELMAKLK